MSGTQILTCYVIVMFLLCEAPSRALPNKMLNGLPPGVNKTAPRTTQGIRASRKALNVSQLLPESSEGYIYPIMLFGPNNQIAGLKEALVLGRLLNRTVIVHDVRSHYENEALDPYPPPPMLKFSLVFNLEHLARHQSVVTLEKQRAAGWNSKLDAVVHFGSRNANETKNAKIFNVSVIKARFIDFGVLNCNIRALESIRKQLVPYRYVGTILYQSVIHGSGRGMHIDYGLTVCHKDFLRVSRHLVRSPTLKSLATSFRATHLGGADKRYAAVHIRPYPDACVKAWLSEDREVEKRRCQNPNLQKVIANQTAAAMRQYGLSLLFVMTVPVLRPRVAKLYGKVGLSPVFMSEKPIVAALGYVSVSLLGMVEQEIALQADVFIGMDLSSMTGVIMQDRAAANKPLNTTLAFKNTTREFLAA